MRTLHAAIRLGPREKSAPGYDDQVAKASTTPANGRGAAKGGATVKGGATAKGRAAAKDPNGFLGGNRWDRLVGSMFFGIMLISVLSFLLLMVGGFTGFLNTSNFDLYATLLMIPLIGLPLAIVLLVVLVIRMAFRRRRENSKAA